jgi:N,N'-diacetyllegionaminate synthase
MSTSVPHAERPRGSIGIGGREFSEAHPLIIGEVAQAHDGSLGHAHAFIDAIANAGADAVKFQTHFADEESTVREPWRVAFSKQDALRIDYWRRMEFTPDQWRGLADHAAQRGLLFLSSPFSSKAARLLHELGVPAWKVASGEVANPSLFEHIAHTGLPVLLSTGMSALAEIDEAAERVRKARLPLVLMQCTSVYPTPPEKLGLNVLAQFRERYGCAVGLSDHSGVIHAGLAAAALGVTVIEVHIALSREAFGPDVVASLTTSELRTLVDGVRFIARAQAHPVDKDAIARELAGTRAMFSKSVVAARDLEPGTVLTRDDLALKKPGTGIPAARVHELVGRRVIRFVKVSDALSEQDLSPTLVATNV